MNIKSFGAMLIAAVMFAGCASLKKMIKDYPKVSYTVTPSPMETHGGKVVVTVSGKYPPKYFLKKAVVTLTPVIKFDGGETPMKPITIIGEAAPGEGQKINNAAGGSFSYTDSVEYKPSMKKSELTAKMSAALGKKTQDFEARKIADGMITTSLRVQNEEDIMLGADKYVKETIIVKSGEMYFPIQQSVIPGKEMNSASMKELKTFAALKYKTKKITVKAYASPDGAVDLNDRLSNQRAQSAFKFIQGELKRMKIEGAQDAALYETVSKGEFWDGFVDLVSKSSMQDKDIIVNIVKSHSDVDKREQEIKNLAVVYTALANDILPKLRKAEIIIDAYEPKKTDAQIDSLAMAMPDSLKTEELLYAAAMTADLDKKLKIYEAHSRIYADDWRGYNNVACVNMQKKNTGEAMAWLEKAKAVKGAAEVINNMGVIAAWNGDYETAKTHFEDSKSKGGNVNNNLGAISIRQGDYAAANDYFGSGCSHNAALAQLLAGNTEGAGKKAECTKDETAALMYLKAIIGAKSNDKGMLSSNLKKAVEKEPTYRNEAMDDLEFVKFREDSDFKGAIQ